MLALILGCAAPGVDSAAPAPAALEASRVAYRLETDWTGAERTAEGWEFRTDLGYRVVLEAAWVSTTSLELVPCPADTGLAWGFSLVSTARAHGAEVHDTSQIDLALVEDLVVGEPLDVGAAPGSGAAYCSLYEVMGPSEAGVVSHVIGEFQAPGGEEVAFDAEDTVPLAARPELLEGAWTDDAGDADAAVILTRRPARALDALALEDLSALELAYAFAWALGQGLEARWELERS